MCYNSINKTDALSRPLFGVFRSGDTSCFLCRVHRRNVAYLFGHCLWCCKKSTEHCTYWSHNVKKQQNIHTTATIHGDPLAPYCTTFRTLSYFALLCLIPTECKHSSRNLDWHAIPSCLIIIALKSSNLLWLWLMTCWSIWESVCWVTVQHCCMHASNFKSFLYYV